VKLKIINDKHDFIAKSNEVKIIYIQPHTTTQSLDNILYIDFNWIAGWLRNHYKNDEFALRFATTLQRWAVD
jgi:hypothetical protein